MVCLDSQRRFRPPPPFFVAKWGILTRTAPTHLEMGSFGPYSPHSTLKWLTACRFDPHNLNPTLKWGVLTHAAPTSKRLTTCCSDPYAPQSPVETATARHFDPYGPNPT